MVTYDDFLQTCYDLCKDSNPTTQTFIARIGNVGYRRAMKLFGKQFQERTQTTPTVSLQQYYQLPSDYSFMKSVQVLVGTQQYPLTEIKSQDEWNDLNRMTNQSNTRPTKYFLKLNVGISGAGSELGIWPMPSANGNTITTVYESVPKDLGNSAYTAGTISLPNASITLTGTGTAFNPNMVGRFLNVPDPAGDGQWYRISAYASASSLTLGNYYQGNTLSGANYGIYELFSLPEEAQMIPVYYAVCHYYMFRQNATQVKIYKALYDEELRQANVNQSSKGREGVVKRGQGIDLTLDYPQFFPNQIQSGA